MPFDAVGRVDQRVGDVPRFVPEHGLVGGDVRFHEVEGETGVAASSPLAPQAEAPDAPVLEVAYTDGRVTIHARRQALPAILYEVATKAGVPFSLRTEPGEPIDLDRADLPLDQLPAGLPAGVRLLVRRDLASGDVTPIRIEMVAPEPPRR